MNIEINQTIGSNSTPIEEQHEKNDRPKQQAPVPRNPEAS
jgi:hypothetical protein